MTNEQQYPNMPLEISIQQKNNLSHLKINKRNLPTKINKPENLIKVKVISPNLPAIK